MRMNSGFARKLLAFVVTSTMILGSSSYVAAHCDTMDGPVIQDARKALESRDVTSALKWVKEKDEKTIRAAFTKALNAKGKKNATTEENRFFATLVKVHRAGEGAPFTGLKPTGTVEPAVAEADKALASGSSAALVKYVNDAVADGIKKRFERAAAAYKNKNESVSAGREFVDAYVDYTHYVERLHLDAATNVKHAERHTEAAPAKHRHDH
jgi:hypothetical protein